MRVVSLAARARRAFTVVEAAVVLALVAIVAAAVVPKLIGTADYTSDAQAEATASAALSAEVSVWLATGGYGTGQGVEGSSAYPAPATNGIPDPSASPGSEGGGAAAPAAANILGACTDPGEGPSANFYASASHTAAPTGVYPVSQPTNCPAFADPASLSASASQVSYVPGDQASPSPQVASVAALDTPSGWRLAAAVSSSSSVSGGVSECVAVWHQFVAPGVDGQVEEEYFVVTSSPSGPQVTCTANAALSWTTSASDVVVGGGAGSSYCSDPGDDPSGQPVPPMGGSWQRPCTQFTVPSGG